MANNIKHNHHPNPFGAYQAPGECPRCDQLRTEKQAAGETQHNHARQPFGRRVDGCPRCIELASGAPARETNASRQARLDADHARSIREHFGPGHNERCSHMKFINGGWTGVCTFGDW